MNANLKFIIKTTLKKILRYIFILILVLVLVVVGALLAIQTPTVQTFLVDKVMTRINQEFGTTIDVGEVDIDFFGDIILKDVSAKDTKDNTFINIKKLTAELDLWNVIQNASDIKIKSAVLDSAQVEVITYKGDSVSNFIRFIDRFSDDKDTTSSDFKINGNLKINHSQLAIVNQNLPEKEQVWLDSKNLNLTAENVNISNSDYQADIQQLSFEAEKNGEKYTLHNLSSSFEMGDKLLSFKDLSLKTQSSELNGHLIFTFDSFSSFSDFGDKVTWDLDLSPKDKIGFKDIRYFVPDWDSDAVVDVQGKATGVLNNLNLKNFKAQHGDTKVNATYLNLQDVMNGSYGVYSKKVYAKTSYTALKKLLPTFVSKQITDYVKRLGEVAYQGELSLNEKDLQVNGNTQTALGSAKIKANLYNMSGANPSYDGYINTTEFDLNKLTDVESLGKVSGMLNFKGKSFDLKNIEVQVEGKLSYIDLANSRWQNINLDGILKDEQYQGFVGIKDPSKIDMTYQGSFDFGEEKMQLNFDSHIGYINLYELGASKQKNTWLRAEAKGNASFSDINDLQGDFVLDKVTFNTDTLQVNFPESKLVLDKDKFGNKNVEVEIPGYLKANLLGKFMLDEVPAVFQNGLGNFLVDAKPIPVSEGQSFSFVLSVEDDFVNYFLPELSLAPQTVARGTVINDAHFFDVEVNSPKIKYQDMVAQEVKLLAQANIHRTIDLKSQNITVKGLAVREFKLKGRTTHDTLNAKMNFLSGEKYRGEYDLDFYQTFDENKRLKVGFSPSTIKIDEQVWDINPNNQNDVNYAVLDFKENHYWVKDLLFKSGGQSFSIKGDYVDDKNFKIEANLTDILLSKIIPKAVLGDMSLEGTVNGNVDVTQTENALKPVADLRVDSIKLNQHLIGNFVADAKYDVENQIFDLSGSLDKDNLNTLYISGDIDNKGEKPKLDMVASLDDFDIGILGIFLDEVLTEWKGKLSGDVSLKGDVDNPEVLGNVTTKNVGFKVVYLGTYYQFLEENDILISKQPGEYGTLILPDIEFMETTSKTQGTVDGSLIFSDLATWFLNLNFDSPNLMVLNTTIKDNELFYGKVWAKGEFYLFGPATDLSIGGEGLDILKGSVLNLNMGGPINVEENKFIQFYTVDTEGNVVEDKKEETGISGFSIDLDFSVNDDSTMNLILSNSLEDKVQVRGKANNFHLGMNKVGTLNMNGTYTVTEGTYNYREGIIIDKEFNIENGGTIRFNGSPYKAQLDLRAIYERNVSNLGTYLGTNYVQTTEVDVVISITGNLEQTDIGLDLELPDSNSQIESMLSSRIGSSTDEKTKQVGSVLVLGRFDVSDDSQNTSAASDAVTASAFELLGKQVGSAFSSIIPGLEINPVYLQATDSSDDSDEIKTEINYTVNQRLKINGAVGTYLETQTTNSSMTASVEVEYDVSKKADGGLKLRAFSKPTTLGLENYNIDSRYAQSYGAGIVFQRSFDRFGDLFRSEEKRRKLDSLAEVKQRKDSLDKKALIQFTK